ncbi:hypothetical protein KR059_008868, partial [Drosophila kikkawai]
MFTCRFLARLSRNQATLASLGCLTIPQRLASHRILPSSPMAITNALIPCTSVNANRRFASNEIETETTSSSLDSATYERVCSETLDALCDYFEELTENAADLQGSDVAYSVSFRWCLHVTSPLSVFAFPSAGWSAHCEPGTQPWHLCDQQADAQQADMAQLPHQWTQAIRFRWRRRRSGQVGLQAQWPVAARAAAAGDTEYIEATARGLSPPALL